MAFDPRLVYLTHSVVRVIEMIGADALVLVLAARAMEFVLRGNEAVVRANLNVPALPAKIFFQDQWVEGHHQGCRAISGGQETVFKNFSIQANGRGEFVSPQIAFSGNFYDGKFHDLTGEDVRISGPGKMEEFINGQWRVIFSGTWKLSKPWTGNVTDMAVNNGDRYSGGWQDSSFHGIGVYSWASGAVYTGHFADGQRDGNGMCVYANGSKYDGEWRNDMRNGHGVFAWASGSVYTGNFLDGESSGRGMLVCADGRKYDGEWRNNEKNGLGVFTWPNGSVYTGNWMDGERNGHGVFVFADGRRYDGEWRNGKKNGQGVFTWPDGMVCTGNWVDDQRNGHGVHTWASGDVYTGNWVDDERSGQGVLSYADGGKYAGEWKNNERHGHGVCSSANGDTYTGVWFEGEP